VVAIGYWGRTELLNYLYVTRFLWQFLTGWPLASPFHVAG
jgi:hypothetical protein